MAHGTPLIAFGLIADVHACGRPDPDGPEPESAGTRRYRGALEKLSRFAEAMDGARAGFIAVLGDLIDKPPESERQLAERRAEALVYLSEATVRLARFGGPCHLLFGNHDTDFLSKTEFVRHAADGVASNPGYRSWTAGGVHFIALDGGYRADGPAYSGVPGDPGHPYEWSDANIHAEQRDWLADDLATHPLPAVVLIHQPLGPMDIADPAFDPRHRVRQAGEVNRILEGSGRVLAVFSGHWHQGGTVTVNGIPHIGLTASAAFGPDPIAHGQHALVTVSALDGRRYALSVSGYGRQASGTWIVRADV
jgi:3',5'-cyclic AMP phosphodiesterase CpdA